MHGIYIINSNTVMILNFNGFVNEHQFSLPNRPSHHLDASKVFYNKETKTFSVELSELDDFAPLVKDGMEIIVIENPKTNVKAEYLKKVGAAERDAENEITHYIYTPKNNTVGTGTKLIIFND
jgi:hypothetical protein